MLFEPQQPDESIAVFEEVIRGFEAAQARLRIRRVSASPDVLVHLERSMELNERTLESLRRALVTASEQIASGIPRSRENTL